jgi:tetratricopeptide (TPR) repeat protein
MSEECLLLSTFLYDRNAAGDREEAATICDGLIRGANGRVNEAIEILVHVRSQQRRGNEVLGLLSSLTDAQLPAVARQTCHSLVLLIQEDREDALRIAKDSIGLLNDQTPMLDRWRLARLLGRLGAHFEAVDVLSGVVQKGRLDLATQQLLDSAQLAGRHDVVLRTLRELREAGVNDDRALRNEVALLQIYNPEEAVRILNLALEKNPENKQARLWLALLGARLHRPEFNCADPDMLPSAEDADPSVIGRWVVQALARAGNSEGALRIAYQILRKHYDHLDAHRTYLFLFLVGPLAGDQPKVKLEAPTTVGEGAAVGYMETGESEVRWVLLESVPPIPGRIGEIPLSACPIRVG